MQLKMLLVCIQHDSCLQENNSHSLYPRSYGETARKHQSKCADRIKSCFEEFLTPRKADDILEPLISRQQVRRLAAFNYQRLSMLSTRMEI